MEALADELQMPTENLLTPDLLRRVAWSPPEPLSAASVGEMLAELGARPWQIAQTAQLIADAFVQSVQSAVPAPESRFVGSIQPIPGAPTGSYAECIPTYGGRVAEISDVFFVDGMRTPFGRAGEKGMYWNTRADDLAVKAIIGLMERNPGRSRGPDRRRRDGCDLADRRPGPDARSLRRASWRVFR